MDSWMGVTSLLPTMIVSAFQPPNRVDSFKGYNKNSSSSRLTSLIPPPTYYVPAGTVVLAPREEVLDGVGTAQGAKELRRGERVDLAAGLAALGDAAPVPGTRTKAEKHAGFILDS